MLWQVWRKEGQIVVVVPDVRMGVTAVVPWFLYFISQN